MYLKITAAANNSNDVVFTQKSCIGTIHFDILTTSEKYCITEGKHKIGVRT